MKYLNLLIEFLVILGLFVAVFFIGLDKAYFHPDESMWINQSYHFEEYITGNFSAIAKQERNFAFTMPTVPEFVIGLSRSIGGYGPSTLNKIWDWNKTDAENKAMGSIPPPNLIWWARFLPSLLGITSILVTFYLIKFAFNTRIGYIWVVLTLINPWIILRLREAMGEPPLLFNIIIAMYACFMAIKSFENTPKMRYSLLWLVIFGIFTGLAGQSKLNGLAIFGAGIVTLLLLTARTQANQRWRFLLLGFAGLTLSTFIFFVGSNPVYWADPIGKTIQTYQYRVEIMTGMQAQVFPGIVIHGWRNAIQIAFVQIFRDLTSIPISNSEYIKFVLSGFGFIVLIAKIQPVLMRNASSSPMNAGAIAIFLVGLFASVPNLFTPLNIDRYFMLPVYFVSILIAIGLDWFVRYCSSIQSNAPDSAAESQPAL